MEEENFLCLKKDEIGTISVTYVQRSHEYFKNITVRNSDSLRKIKNFGKNEKKNSVRIVELFKMPKNYKDVFGFIKVYIYTLKYVHVIYNYISIYICTSTSAYI
jgi:hypothetical protein